MDNTEVVEHSQKKRKKGVRNKQDYASEIIKKSRVSGNAYINNSGKPVMELQPGVDCKCRRMCYIKVSEENRLGVFQNFRSMNSKNEQDNYLQSLISASEVKQRRRRKPEEESNKPERGTSFIYEISTSSGKHQVCKTAFINIHAITNERIRRLTSLLKEGKTPTDKRGKNTPGNAKPGFMLDAVKKHIASFPVKIAHYSSREYTYLSEQLNVLQMYNLFKEENPQIDIGYKFYLKIFKEDFSLSFGRPQVDTCCTCEELTVKIKSKFLNEVAKRVHVAEKLVHVRRANKFYSKMKAIKEMMATQSNIGAICIDYMQNVSLPTVPVQETFYLRQLTVSVFCIHNLRDDSVVLFLYHEGIATKGPNEVTSFIMDYLKTSLKDIEHLHIFSDGCSAQNKNHTLLRAINSLVSLGKLKSAEQYFPIRGHSFLPCDRDFAVIKRKLRKFDRVFTIEELAAIISSAPKKNNFSVIIPKTDEIIDYKSWWPALYKRNVLSEETRGKNIHKNDKVSFKISQFMHISHTCEKPGIIKARNYIDGIQVHTFDLRGSKRCQLTLPQNPAYPQGLIPINKKKMKDLEKFKPYIPDDDSIKSFYDDIFTWPTIENETACEADFMD